MKRKILLLLMFIFISIGHFSYATNDTNSDLKIYSDAAILIDANTGTVLYSKKSDERLYPARLFFCLFV